MSKKTDPRISPASLDDVPALLGDGAAHYDAGRYWDAHESWEDAWHALRNGGRDADAAFLQGLILMTAAFENLRRGKPRGFRRQMAEALHRMRAHPGAGTRLGLDDEAAFIDALLTCYLDGARRTYLADLDHLEAPPPRLTLRDRP